MPPCVASPKQIHKVQTVVLKVTGASNDLLDRHHQSWIWSGAGASAHVEVLGGEQQGHYLVMTNQTSCEENSLAARMRSGLQQLPGSPQVEWIRPLTRRLQRILRWGDVAATREDVARAAKAGDVQELKAIMPEAAAEVLDSEDLSQLPALFDALRIPPPALEDCTHVWYTWDGPLAARDKCAELQEQADSKGQPFDELGTRNWLMKGDVGRCNRDATHPGPFWRCTSCRLVACHACAHCKTNEQRASRKVQELKGTAAAATGALLDEVRFQWRQHPELPLPFFVTDQIKVSDEEKVVWIRQEIGNDAELAAFSVKFLELFGDRLRGAVPQKSACLKLFGVYSDAAPDWRKECDLPPNVLQDFQRVWEPAAPERCLECNKRAAPGTKHPLRRLGRAYCSLKCSDAGTIVGCKRCTPERKCGFCSLKPAPLGESRLDQVLRENELQLKRARHKMTGDATLELDPNHDPAWKRRRRS
jgi:hypothetical protein